MIAQETLKTKTKQQNNFICVSCWMSNNWLKLNEEKREFLISDTAISFRLDNCDSLLAELSQYLIQKLQKVQNCAARIILNVKKYDSPAFAPLVTY